MSEFKITNTIFDKKLDVVEADVKETEDEEEKEQQIERLRAFHAHHKDEAPQALERLKRAALSGNNIFAELMETVRSCSLGQITQALFEVGGQYRRNM